LSASNSVESPYIPLPFVSYGCDPSTTLLSLSTYLANNEDVSHTRCVVIKVPPQPVTLSKRCKIQAYNNKYNRSGIFLSFIGLDDNLFEI